MTAMPTSWGAGHTLSRFLLMPWLADLVLNKWGVELISQSHWNLYIFTYSVIFSDGPFSTQSTKHICHHVTNGRQNKQITDMKRTIAAELCKTGSGAEKPTKNVKNLSAHWSSCAPVVTSFIAANPHKTRANLSRFSMTALSTSR